MTGGTTKLLVVVLNSAIVVANAIALEIVENYAGDLLRRIETDHGGDDDFEKNAY